MSSDLRSGLIPYLRRVAGSAGADDADGPLLQRFVAHADEAAFAALVQRHGPMVLGVCQRVLHNGHDAEDAFQATFLVLARKASAVGRPEQLANWLYGVAYRTALEAKTRRARRQLKENQAVGPVTVEPSLEAAWAEIRQVLDDEVQRLPARYRLPFVLCYLEGKTNDEAAQLMGCPPGTVYSRLAWARERLRGRLTRRGLGFSAGLFAAVLAQPAAEAALPAPLAAATVKAAASSTPVLSFEVAALTQGVLKAMQWSRIKTVVTEVLGIVGLLGLGVFLLCSAASPRETESAPVQPGQAAAPKQKPKADEDRIVGTWRFVKGEGNGEMLPAEFITLGRMTFTKDGKMTISLIEEVRRADYKFPKAGQIDLPIDNEVPSLGIYKFDGDDRLTLCINLNANNENRPREYRGDAGSGQFLIELVRAKPGEEKPTKEEIAKNKEAIDKIKEAAARAQSQNNLKQIGIAFHVYHGAEKALPLHAIYSKDGKTPLLSWRVALLPYIEHLNLYQQFKLDEPWDSPHNKKLIPLMPKIYASTVEGKGGEGLTYYQVFTGPDTVFPGNKVMTLEDIKDGTSNTLLAIEGKDAVIWTKPADLTLPKDKERLTPVGGLFKNGTNALMCDGSVHFLARSLTPVQQRAMVTPNGND
jgi:RNA polymerase sigma factor (sigma-70 family)